MTNQRQIIAAAALAAIALGTWGLTRGSREVATAPAGGVPQRTKAAPTRQAARPARALDSISVGKITPQEWPARLDADFPEVPPEMREQIVLLSGELRKSIEGGLDPAGDEARAYGETILVLLKEKPAEP